MKMNFTTKKITVAALMMAIICVVTMFAKVPIVPFGYANLGTAVILITVMFLGGEVAILSAGIGSMLADLLLGWPEWMISTLIIKTVMALVLLAFIVVKRKNKTKVLSVRVFTGVILVCLWQVAGYVVAGSIIYGSWASGIASGIGLLIEAGVNVIVFFVVATVLEKAGIGKYLKM